MSRITQIIFFSLSLCLLTTFPLQAGWLPWSSPTLVSIGDEDFSGDDFNSWWENWEEEGMTLPDSPTPYVDWLLLFKEAERMRLFEDPQYHKKVLTFLKVRTLLILKAEEVDKKIIVSDDLLWEKYLQTHAPLYKLQSFVFNDPETAQDFYKKIGPDPLSDEAFTKNLDEQQEASSNQQNKWYRPLAIDPKWLPHIRELETGAISEPLSLGTNHFVLRLVESKDGKKSDFETVKNTIIQAVKKDEEKRLTIEMLRSLRKKYHVTIDNERLEQLDIYASNESYTDTPIITTSNGNITEKQVIGQIRRQKGFRKQYGFKDDNDIQLKQTVINGIIDQTLTSWEGLARGYETRPPLDKVYQFYCQHQLIRLLENRLFLPKAEVKPEEVLAYYQDNISSYTSPEIVQLAIINGEAKELNSLWVEATLGEDLLTIAEKRYHKEVPIRNLPLNHLTPEMKKAVLKLTTNEVSPVFMINDIPTLIKLIQRTPSKITPIGKVGFEITEILQKKKVETVRQEYLAKLRAEYPVEINKDTWEKVRKELEQEDEQKNDA